MDAKDIKRIDLVTDLANLIHRAMLYSNDPIDLANIIADWVERRERNAA